MSDQTPPFDPSKVDKNDPFADLPRDTGAPPAPAPTAPPVETPVVPPAAVVPPVPQPTAGEQTPVHSDPAAPAATPRTWKVPITVAGQTREIEVSEEAFTNPDSEAAKALRARLQKAEDYDRPGGALDQQAQRRAQEMAQDLRRGDLEQMVRDGIVERNPNDGRYYYTQTYKRAVEEQKNPKPAAPPTPTVDPRDEELKSIDKKIADLEKLAESDDDGVDARKVYIELGRIGRQRSDLAAEIRADRHARTEADRVRAEQAARDAQRTALTDQERATADNSRTLQTTVDGTLERHKAALVDPVTGHPLSKEEVDHLRQTAYNTAVAAAYKARDEGRDGPTAGFAAAREWLDGHLSRRGAEITRFRAAMPKIAPAAPAAAPTFGGGSPPPAQRPAPTFNKNDPFDDRALNEHMATLNGRA